ncbi:hypothetical protein LJC56_02445 [Christensenellaceae bacterium OttesenSCG-928-K19]|nr:hypothetical protein [Christensenellaceae bacterium OttesenSCG-928-K19]
MSNINGVSNQGYNAYAAKTNPDQASTNNTNGKTNSADTVITDELELSSQSAKDAAPNNKIYTRDTAKANALKQVTQQNLTTLQNMVNKLLGNQNNVSSSLTNISEEFFSFKFDFSFANGDSEFNFNFNYESYSFSMEQISANGGMVEIDQATRDEAAGLIGEDGPLGVKQVSQNILDFAKAISGGDPSKIDVLKNAFIKGFDEVANMFGGRDKMPEISQKTYDAVMTGFDAWENGEE